MDEYMMDELSVEFIDESIDEQKELLQIIDEDYIEELHYDMSKDYVEIFITEEIELQANITRAKKEEWEYLCITFENVLEVPPEIGELTCLKGLVISYYCEVENEVLHLPSEIGKLTNLESLNAYKCGLIDLPKEFVCLSKLRELNLNDNNFNEFPNEILSLINLESLAINNNFSAFPDEICKLKKLRCLYAPNANVSFLPEKIGELVNLENLCIWGTNISWLPTSCLNLKSIKSLYLTRSLFEHIIPPEIINQSPIEAINYIIKYQNDKNKKQINESKMIIVGQGGVGKTCVLNRLIYDKYNEMVSTEGIDIETWDFKLEDKEYKLNVWDFGGQEIYHATHQFFLTNRSLYIFVWDARQEEEYGRIDYWLHTIESFAYNSPIIIVINKCDSRNSIKQLDIKSIKEKFPQVIDCFKISCKENIGILDLKNVIMEETVKLPLMDIVWLSSWLEVRHELEFLVKTKNIITYKEYEEICLKHNILSAEALSLSKYLHDLGIIINFQKDFYLKNIVILDPEWGTNAVYKVLDAQETVLKGRNGILYYDDLKKIWTDETEYPKDTYPIILRLMENFQLSFEVKNNAEYLIAELLENEEIIIPLDDEKKQILNFQYNYEFLPAGIMTRFIVKANQYLIEDKGRKVCWKKGAYLKYEDSMGIVKLYDGISERKIEIQVIGFNNRSNRDLLVIIRKFFDEIHSSIPKIKYTEFVKCNCKKDCTYLHDYRYLLKLEEHGLESERCKESLKLIQVSQLLDGMGVSRKNRRRKRINMGNIEVSPQITIKNTNNNYNSNYVENTISIEIRNDINELLGNINDLKDEIIDSNTELFGELEKIEKSVLKITQANSKEEVVQVGTLKKIQRFLVEIENAESEYGKTIRGLKYGISIVQEIVKKYNSIAQWCGLPIVPNVFLE